MIREHWFLNSFYTPFHCIYDSKPPSDPAPAPTPSFSEWGHLHFKVPWCTGFVTRELTTYSLCRYLPTLGQITSLRLAFVMVSVPPLKCQSQVNFKTSWRWGTNHFFSLQVKQMKVM